MKENISASDERGGNEKEQTTLKLSDLIKSRIVDMNVNDVDYQAARALTNFLISTKDVRVIDMEKIFARTGFEQDCLIDLLKEKGIKLINYKGIGKYLVEGGVEVEFAD
jgi:hypothetical protein